VNALGFVKMASTKTENGITYNVYIHSDANTDAKAALWVQFKSINATTTIHTGTVACAGLF
jgi:hypothetical protein